MEKRKFKIIIAEPEDFSEKAHKQLCQVGSVVKGPFTKKELTAVCQDAEVLILRLGHYIDAELLASSTLKYILTPTTGLNHIDLKEAEKKQIEIISLKGKTEFLQNIPSTAEHTWALLLALLRKIPAAHTDVMQGNWNRDAFKSRNLNALKLGILGYGRVGKQIAKYAEAFDMDYIFFDSNPTEKKHPKAVSNMEDLWAQSDVLSIHIPLNQKNEKFLNQQKINQLKPGVLLINTSRGEIVDEKALVEGLKSGKIGAVATDVLIDEWQPQKRKKNPLLVYAKKNKNVIITPHIAGATIDSMHLTEEFIVHEFFKQISK